MKKISLLIGIMLVTLGTTQAQELGVRFGDVIGGNVALDAVFSTSEFSRIHADVSFGGSGIGVDALWDFAYKPMGDLPLNWYAGVGPSVYLGNPLALAAAGELGLEYRFDSDPISLSLDWRPYFVLVEYTDFYGGAFGFNIRYIFK